GLAPQTVLPQAGTRVPFTVLVRNTGTVPLEGLTVTLQSLNSDRDLDTTTVPVLGPGETRPLTLSARLERAGFQVVTARLTGDALPADNRRDCVVEVRDEVKVLVVDCGWNAQAPDKAASYFLAHALRPVADELVARHPVRVRILPPWEAEPGMLA